MKNLPNVKELTAKNANTIQKEMKKMNKEYTVTYRTVNGFLDSEEFDDLLKMWEFVIRLKEDAMVTKIWVDTSQVVFEREDW